MPLSLFWRVHHCHLLPDFFLQTLPRWGDGELGSSSSTCKGRDSLGSLALNTSRTLVETHCWGLIFPRPRLAWGGQAQISHLSRDCTGLASGAVRSSSWIYGLGCLLHEEGILLREDSITSRIERRGVLVPATPWEPEGSTSLRSPSSTISVSVSSSSSCSWKISSSWWASSSCILQSSRMSSYLMMARSIAVREVCKEFNLCSSSLPDAALVTTCMASDVASNSTRRLDCHLLHFPREVATLVHLFSMYLWFSLRTWVITSSNSSSQAVLGLRK